MVAVVVAAGAGSVLVAGGCHGCTGAFIPALVVTVLDGPAGPVCDATVTATTREGTTTLGVYDPGDGSCSYSGGGVAGTYTLEATFEGRTVTTPNVHVTHDGCHPNTREIEMVLPAAPVAETPAEP